MASLVLGYESDCFDSFVIGGAVSCSKGCMYVEAFQRWVKRRRRKEKYQARAPHIYFTNFESRKTMYHQTQVMLRFGACPDPERSAANVVVPLCVTFRGVWIEYHDIIQFHGTSIL